MGWGPSDLGKDKYLILSAQGGIGSPDGSPIALGYHTGKLDCSPKLRLKNSNNTTLFPLQVLSVTYATGGLKTLQV